MKRLFRTSKSGAVDPLPPPIPIERPPSPPPARKSISNLLMGTEPRNDRYHHHQTVSPFPVEQNLRRRNLPSEPIPLSIPRHTQTSPDGWTVLPTPVDNELGHTSPQPVYYLPPGAGPPSPQARPITPPKSSYPPNGNRVSQSSLNDPLTRERGYSSASASGRGSDLESSTHGHLTSPLPPKHGTRSPLVNTYDIPTNIAFPVNDSIQGMTNLMLDEPKEKRKFWGWGDKRPKEVRQDDDYLHEEERGRIAGVKEVNDAGTAIKLLCGIDPPISSILDVCDRVNHSQSPDVGKEAARSIRKELKNGNEAERRTAAKIWLIMMRNVSLKGFRQHASSKKFLASLEMILLAPSAKPLVSASTHRLLTDVLAGLTYQYGMEKGCEGLAELWRRVKLPQEPDIGYALPSDHLLYSAPQPPFIPYTQLPDHKEDMRRLSEECTAARESARVLSEALVYTRPEELEAKEVIREFYRKCFLAHESITNQMDWAQAEASRSRGGNEEQVLAALFDAHAALTEALRQHEELERMAADEKELREVRERSRKETRMNTSLLQPEPNQSTSREPSPAPINRILQNSRSRTPSPDHHHHPLPHPPKLSQPTSRAASPLGKKISRPLPDPFKQTPSNQSLSGQTHEDVDIPPTQPSRKALGKRRAIPDEDNHFNPDDMFSDGTTKEESDGSDDSITADEVYLAKPVVYAYDAYQERQAALRSGQGGGGSRIISTNG